MKLKKTANRLAAQLLEWYGLVKRPLPWRVDRDPYHIWVSEIMLQQTTVAAVIPYFERFMQRFPDLASLAKADEHHVVEYWAGLGYYSRARGLHKSARYLAELTSFPRTYAELMELPGFGPYTARAVSSQAFGETVGVVDGNVIRVLSRLLDLDLEHWKPKARDLFQVEADFLANAEINGRAVDPSDLNQAVMELGATVCTPKSPMCLLCPWQKSCLARANDTIRLRPRPKPKKEFEIWQWSPEITQTADGQLLLVKNDYAPFLKGHFIWPGTATRLKKKPTDFDFKGGVTKFDIYVNVSLKTVKCAAKASKESTNEPIWIREAELKTKVPSSLVRKALDVIERA